MKIYPHSLRIQEGVRYFLARIDNSKKLIVQAEPGKLIPSGFIGELRTLPDETAAALVCPLSPSNTELMRTRFPFMRPCANPGFVRSLGLGDRLGLASPGHLDALVDADFFPILAQQSMRELRLTGRTYPEVLDAASWAVFQEGFDKGFGADGDHLKTGEEIDYAIRSGFTMITLDCSDYIHKDIALLPPETVHTRYLDLPETERHLLEQKYVKSPHPNLLKLGIILQPADLERTVLTYRAALSHMVEMYETRIRCAPHSVDYEISIDETATITRPADHAFVALELLQKGVRFTSLAPRFCGEFQKGIDYRGDAMEFQHQFREHAKIARTLGYRLSIHSGSDKFRIFPIVGEEASEGFHVKTAGTHWLEAVRVIAKHAPSLYRDMHAIALASLQDARLFYHISADEFRVPPLQELSDAELPLLMDQEDARQILHITYGHILKAPATPAQAETLKSRIYATLDCYETPYAASLCRHVKKHIDSLNQNIRQ